MTVRDFASVKHADFSKKVYFNFLDAVDGTYCGSCSFEDILGTFDVFFLDRNLSKVEFDFEGNSLGESSYYAYVR